MEEYALGLATEGLLGGCNYALPIATLGYLNNCDVEVAEVPGLVKKSSGGKGIGVTEYEYITPGKFDYRVYTEEEEILLLIKIFLHVNK